MSSTTTSDDILGKKALDCDGDILGIVTKLHIDSSSKKILGVSIEQGFMKPDLFIGTDSVEFFGVGAVLLNQSPIDRLKGLEVFSESGKFFGKVVGFNEENNNLRGVTYRKFLAKPGYVENKNIKIIGKSIIVKD